MKFNRNGYLEPGFHDLLLEGIIEHFVTAFPTSNTRKVIIEGYKRHRDDLVGLGITSIQFLDGSFVSTKADPGDVDMVGFMDLDAVDALSSAEKDKLKSLFSGKFTKSMYQCDAYFVPVVPESHPLYDKLRSQRKYWMGEFGYDREDRPKGIVRTEVSPPDVGQSLTKDERDG